MFKQIYCGCIIDFSDRHEIKETVQHIIIASLVQDFMFLALY